MKTLAALALVLAACATNAAPNISSQLDVRDSKDGIAGTFEENDTAINFRFSHGDIEITTADGFRIFEDHHGGVRALETYSPSVGTRFSPDVLRELASMPELDVIRDLPGALHDRGIEVADFVRTSPTLGQILCPTLTATDLSNAMVDHDATAAN